MMDKVLALTILLWVCSPVVGRTSPWIQSVPSSAGQGSFFSGTMQHNTDILQDARHDDEIQQQHAQSRSLAQQPIVNPRVPSSRTPSLTMESGSIASKHLFIDSLNFNDNPAEPQTPPVNVEQPNSGGGDRGGDGKSNAGRHVLIWFSILAGAGLAYGGYRRWNRQQRFQRATRMQSYDDVYDNIHAVARFSEVPMVPVRTASHQAPLRNSTYV